MNKIYKVIYCKATQAWVAVSELAKGRSKGGTRSSRINRTEFFSGRVKILSASVMLALGGQASAGGCPGLNGSTVECGSGSDASGSRAVAIGYAANAEGGQSVAVGGKGTHAQGDQSIAIGGDTVASGADSIAIGGDDLDKVANDSPPPWNATGLTNTSFNTSAVATKYHDQTGQWLVDVTGGPSTRYIKAEAKGAGSVVLGVQSKAVGDLATAIGTGAKAEAFGSTAFGIGAKTTKENSIALGAGSITDSDAAWVPQATIDTLDENGNTVGTLTYTKFAGGSASLATGDQVSVGSVGFERQIKNVAPGEISATSTDAINGSQLAAVAGKLQYQTQTYFHVNENNASQGAGNATTNFGAIRDKAGATGDYAVTAGVGAQATAVGGIAIGNNAESEGEHAVVIGGNGSNSATNEFSVAMGKDTTSSGFASTATGQGTTASGKYSMSMGVGSTASGEQAVAAGNTTVAEGNGSMAVGEKTHAQGVSSLAAGTSTHAEGVNSMAMGNETHAEGTGSMAVGFQTHAKGVSSLAVGNQTQALGAKSVAMGDGSKTSEFAEAAVAMGSYSESSGYAAVALGDKAKASSYASVAMGNAAVASGGRAVAMGGENSQAIGASSLATGGGTAKTTSSIAMGTGTVAGTDGGAEEAVAIGYSSQATANKAMALGFNAKASHENSVALGEQAETKDFVQVTTATVGSLTYSGFAGTANGVVSVGKAGADKQIVNVAPGEISGTSTDAINGSQLHATNEVLGNVGDTVVGNFGGNAAIDPDGNITFTDVGGTGKNNIHDAIKASKEEVKSDDKSVTVTTTQNAAGANIFDLSVNADGTTIEVEPGTGKVKAVTSDITSNPTGAVTATTPSSLATAGDIANAINNSGFTAKANGDAGELINPGDEVEFLNGDNIEITRTGGQFTIATAKDVSFDSVTTGDTVMNNDDITINNGTAGNPVVLGKSGLDNGGNAITNVAAGVAPTDAVNVSQLTTQIAGSKEEVKSDDKSVTVTTTQNAAGANIFDLSVNVDDSTIEINSTTGQIKAKTDGITTTNGKATATTPTSLATSGDIADAINNSGFTAKANGDTGELINPGDEVEFLNGDNIEITRTGGKFTIATAKDVSFDSVTTGDTVMNNDGITINNGTAGNPVVLGKSGLDNGGNAITNVAAGVAPTDAVNVSQLTTQIAGSKEEVKSDDKSVTVTTTQNAAGANIFDLSVNADGTTIEVEPGTGKVKAVTSDITSNPTGAVTATTPSSLATAGDIANAINNSGFTAKANGDTGELINPGDEVEFLNGDNIEITRTGGKFTIATAKDVSFDSVTTGDTVMNNDGITINNGAAGNPVVLGKSGLDNGGNTITNVAAGVAPTDAVNVSQLTTQIAGSKEEVKSDDKSVTVTTTQNAAGANIFDLSVNADGTTIEVEPGTGKVKAVTSDITSNPTGAVTATTPSSLATAGDIANAINNSGFTAKANGDAGELINPGDEVEFLNGDNIEITRTGGKFTIATAKDVSFDSVTAGDSKIDNNGLTINGGPSVTKAGINAGDKQIKGVSSGLVDAGGNPVTIANATGDTLTNAANIGDLQKVQGTVTNVNNLIGGTDINDPAVKDALKTYDVSGQTATNDNSIISAIKNMNEGGIKYFHTNDDSGQKTGGAVANTNDSSASGKFATAVGYQASATAEGAIAIGKGSQATGQNSIAIGTGHKVTGNNSGAIGDPTYINADDSYAIGNNNTIAAGSDKVFILGNDVNVGAGHTGAVVLGDQSTIDSVHTGDYTYGGVADAKVSGSKGAGTQVVSVGSVGGERQIQNVAPGVISDSSTDAVNGSQLYVVGKAVSVNSTAINANSTAIGANSAAISNNVYHIGKNTGKINDNRIQINANTATIGKGVNIGSDSGDTVNRQLGDTIAITGDKNITTKTTDKGVQVTLNPDISADSLTAGNTLVNHDGVIISGGNNGDIMLTNNGLDNGGNRVKNVAAGINDTDAVNVSQLKEAYQHIDGVKDDASAGIAAAIAMANMPQPHDPGASMMSLGVGAHRDQQAIAIGLSTISDNGKWILKGSLSQDTQDNVSAGVGVGYQW